MGKINVLWTGGLDSTYRMAELSRYSVEVQAYYVVDPIRKSVPQERKAMKTILALLRKNPNTIAKYNDIIEIDRDSIPANEDITASWKVFRDEYRVGSQYDFLARYAKKHNLRMEVSLDGGGTNGHMGRATQAVLEKGDLQIVSTAGGGMC